MREICVLRSRAGFLAARWLELEDAAADSAARQVADIARIELTLVVRRYARLLLELGESRAQALSLVGELAVEVAKHHCTDTFPVEDLRAELVEWAADVSPTRKPTASLATRRAD